MRVAALTLLALPACEGWVRPLELETREQAGAWWPEDACDALVGCGDTGFAHGHDACVRGWQLNFEDPEYYACFSPASLALCKMELARVDLAALDCVDPDEELPTSCVPPWELPCDRFRQVH